MERVLTSLLLVAVASLALPQGFGRFGYKDELNLPGFHVTRNGFRAKQAAADTFAFTHRRPSWNPIETTPQGQTVLLGEFTGAPSKVRGDLLSVGLSLYFPLGVDLEVRSIGAPYLSWAEGSVASGVPTPEVSWIIVSFRNAQPPVLLAFPSGGTALVVEGQAGAWHIRSTGRYVGWVRVALPFGITPMAGNSAASLGEMAERVEQDEEVWLTPTPHLIDTRVEADEESVIATWRFSASRAVVPVGVLLARLGGYPLTIFSKTRSLDAPTSEGPLAVLEGSDLQIRFPARRVPTGKALALGALPTLPVAKVSSLEYTKVIELAWRNALASDHEQTLRNSEETLQEYLSEVGYHEEPWTGQRHPYNEAGAGADLAAAHALLAQAVTSSQQTTPEFNALLTSLLWRTDWYTWRVWTEDRTVSRRAGALAALAASLDPEPLRRLEGALFQAGLSADRGIEIWRRQRGDAESLVPLIEPLEGLRKGLFSLDSPVTADPCAQVLVSDLRVYANFPVSILEREGRKFLSWASLVGNPGVLTLVCPYPLQLSKGNNLAHLDVKPELGSTQVRFTPSGVGTCEVELILPEWARLLPPAAAVPRYSELAR